MRKIASSSKAPSRIRLSSCAEARSRPERLLDDDARARRCSRLRELLDDRPEQHWRDGEVVRRPLGGAEFLADGLERRRVLVVAVDVAQQAAQLVEGGGVEPAVLLDDCRSPAP